VLVMKRNESLKRRPLWRKRQPCLKAALNGFLIVDDDNMLGRLIREALTARFDCEVDATSNPEYAFELALKKRYRVFIFDFSMR